MELARRIQTAPLAPPSAPEPFIGAQSVELEATTDEEIIYKDYFQRVHDRAMVFAEQFVLREDAADVLQTACLEIWRNRNKFLPEERTEALFISVVYQRTVDHPR